MEGFAGAKRRPASAAPTITTTIPTSLPSRRLCLDTGMLPPAQCVELLREYVSLIEES